MKKRIFPRLVFTTAFCLAFFCQSAFSQIGDNSSTTQGYQGTSWGTSLADFRASKGSKVTFSVDRFNARALDYLLMNFHEVDKDDPARAPEFSVQTIAGDKADYLFYDGKFCSASVPLPLEDVFAMEKTLESKYKRTGTATYEVYNVFSGEFGLERVFFHYLGFAPSPATRIYLVKVTSYYETPGVYGRGGYGLVQAEEGDPQGGFLIYASDDYFKGDNAYTDWLANRKNPPTGKMDYLQRLKCGIEH
jgi:hypothetical protein